MSKKIEKAYFSIPPIDLKKELVQKIGRFLEDEMKDYPIQYELNSKTADIESTTIQNFIEYDWPNQISSIKIMVGKRYDYPNIKINIDVDSSFPKDSVEVEGEDPVWVRGISTKLKEYFNDSRLNHYWFVMNWLPKAVLAIISLISLSYFIYTLFKDVFINNLSSYITVSFIFAYVLYYIINKMFPYIEYGNPFYKQIRKYFIAIINTSGLIPYILSKILPQ